MKTNTLPIIANDSTTRVWVNTNIGAVVTDFLGSGDNLDEEDLYNGLHAYSMASVYDINSFPGGKFDVSKVANVADGDMDYDDDMVECTESAMVMFPEDKDYNKREHLGVVMGMLDLPETGWTQVAGPGFDKKA